MTHTQRLPSVEAFYSFMVEKFAIPADLTTGKRNIPFTIYSENGRLFIHNSKGNTHPIDSKSATTFFQHWGLGSSGTQKAVKGSIEWSRTGKSISCEINGVFCSANGQDE
ncbi:TPA: hypothetical protein ACJTCA_001700 [Yersinia enterocolitica]